MRILFHYYTHKPGGLCLRLYRLINYLVECGEEVHLFTLDQPPNTALSPEARVHIIPFWTEKRSGLLFWLTYVPFTALYLAKKQLALRAERLVAFGAIYSAIFCLASILSKARLILFIRSLVFINNRLNKKPAIMVLLSDFLEKVGVKAADRTITMSQAMTSELEKFLATSLIDNHTLPNDVPPPPTTQVDLRAKLNLPTKSQTIVAMGIIDQRKNIATLCEAYRILRERKVGSNCHLIVMGSGELLAQLKDRFRDTAGIYLIGWIENPIRYLDQNTIFVHPSLHEGISNALLEAISIKSLVLVADTDENRELFGAGSQLLFNAYQTNALADLLERTIVDHSFQDYLRAEVLKVGEKLTFDWNLQARELILKVAQLK